jgi:DNA modification methylase
MNQAYNRSVGDWPSFPAYDLMYTDPPWNEGIMKLFQKSAMVKTGRASKETMKDALNQLFASAHRDKPMLVEFSARGWDKVVEIGKYCGHRYTGHALALQCNGKPMVVLSFNTDYLTPTLGLDEEGCIRAAIAALKPGLVFDPFAGLGVTAEIIIKCGARFIGGEMNGARYAELKKVIDKSNQ